MDPLGRVGGEDGDAVAVADAVPLGEARRERCRGGDVLGKGRLGPVVEHVVAGAAVATVIGGVLEQARRCGARFFAVVTSTPFTMTGTVSKKPPSPVSIASTSAIDMVGSAMSRIIAQDDLGARF